MNEKQLWTMPTFALQYQKTEKKKKHLCHPSASSAMHCSRLQVYAWATNASLLRGITGFYLISTCPHAFILHTKECLKDGQMSNR